MFNIFRRKPKIDWDAVYVQDRERRAKEKAEFEATVERERKARRERKRPGARIAVADKITVVNPPHRTRRQRLLEQVTDEPVLASVRRR